MYLNTIIQTDYFGADSHRLFYIFMSMTTNVSLKSIFAVSKEKLSNELKKIVLPKDAQQFQKVVAVHLSELFKNENDFRQSLTESENYILVSALRLLQAQQNITSEITKTISSFKTPKSSDIFSSKKNDTNPYYAIAGAGVGALAGGVLGVWTAVAGAIAGTAVVIYYTNKAVSSETTIQSEVRKNDTPINVDMFIKIVEDICESIDGLIETYRVQVKRIKNSYEQKEKPSLQNEYSALLEQVVYLYNVVKTSKESVPIKISNAADLLAESLENYDMKIENGKIVND